VDCTQASSSGLIRRRHTHDGIEDALKICTINGAYASFEEGIKGSITTGKLADFVILADAPQDVDPDQIKHIEIVSTVVGGKTMYGA